ncbi:peroxiredoxin [Candidatus Gracilibacteria bacterium]|nr:peroxiredoxin [Candidatus Gracilibacteria bacterium]
MSIRKLQVGDTAPNFKAYTQDNQMTELYELLDSGNKVFLIFYPKDSTPGCTQQLCGVRDTYKEFRKRGVRVLGVNHGDSVTHKKFIQKNSFPFDIIVDKDKRIIKDYGCEKKFFKNMVVKRGVFLIKEDKTIEYIFWGQQDNQKVLDILDKNN